MRDNANLRQLPTDDKLEVLQAMLQELVALRTLLDEFCGVLLNSKFQFGKPTDRWSRR
jgi:hypothetical protein